MGKQVLVNESSLVNIANALRSRTGGDVRTEYEVQGQRQIIKISKTPNATSHTQYSGGYGENKSIYDEVTIPGASSINITLSYQTEGERFDYVQVCQGNKSQFNSSVTKYGGKTRTQKTLTFPGDTVTFYFKSDSSGSDFLGYYAEITGVDENNEAIMEDILVPIEVPNVFKPSQMGEAISNIPGMGVLKSAIITGTVNRSLYTATYDLTGYVEDITKPTWFLFARQYAGTTSLNRGDYAMVSPIIPESHKYWGHTQTTVSPYLNAPFTGLTTGDYPLLGDLGHLNYFETTFNKESKQVVVKYTSSNCEIGPSAILFYIGAA